MNRFSVIDVSDNRWTNIISRSQQYDFYHTQSYSLLERNSGTVLCIAYHGKDFIAIPLVLRKIEGTDFFDCTSVYGYCGPVSNLHPENLSTDHILFFQTELLRFFKERHVICAFSRLHPFFNQSVFLNNFGVIRNICNTVAIDLRLSEDDQINGYRKSLKSEIKQMERNAFSVSETSTQTEIDIFAYLYNDSMRRLKAPPSYFYDNKYFYDFLSSSQFETKLLLAQKENEIVAGAIFTLTNRIMQYHLAFSKKGDNKTAPMKLILDQARKIGKYNKMDFLHLGGGVNGSSSDSLFKFKAGFSPLRYVFSTWQLIVDQAKYSHLIKFFNIDRENTTNYFPAYRTR